MDGPVSSGRGGYYGGGSESELNNYCWNYGTFLVAKALEPNMRWKANYPGIWNHSRGEDELVKQGYYNKIWVGLAIIGSVAYLPLLLWKFTGAGDKIKFLAEVSDQLTQDEKDSARVANFTEIVGLNQGLSASYLFCKVLALLTPTFHFHYLSVFIGKRFRFYGADVLMFNMSGGDQWPDPTDALFPKIARCEYIKYGYAEDLGVKVNFYAIFQNVFTYCMLSTC